jgi:hypothetical protein
VSSLLFKHQWIIEWNLLQGKWCLFLSQAFFCGRSEYFNALLRDHFCETTADDGTPMINIRDVPAEVFSAVVYYIYTNIVEVGVLVVQYSSVS